MTNKFLQVARRLFLLLTGAVLMAFNINTFVHAGGLLPGGFTGLTLLTQEICWRYAHIHIPFSVIYYILNLVPAIICFKFIGKKFAMYSILVVLVSGFLTDWMPAMFINLLTTHDILLSAVFGGLLNAFAISLCLFAGATSGGSDFIAIFISEKYHKDAWNYILVGNVVILTVGGLLFGLDRALYSIIFQFVTTVGIGALYRDYQQRTLIIITDKPDDIYKMISKTTTHGATLIDCLGSYSMSKHTLLYSIITASQIKELIPEIKKIDPAVFINVLKTEQLYGRFNQRPKD